MTQHAHERTLGLFGATLVGVGAIVGGGVLALAGVAFATTGPSAILAFAMNGAIAALTALSFAELAAAFPESGGTYTFAKKVLPVEAAFMVGWVVWFASIVAAVLYALGFAAFAVTALESGWQLAAGSAPAWLHGRAAAVALAVGATALYAAGLALRNAGGGQWATIGKVVVFAVLIAAGLWALLSRSWDSVGEQLTPFFANGAGGFVQAMGYTFIALQGFDLIAAVGGEVKDPTRNLPRSMLLSLGIALAIYLPLLLIVATVGVPEGLPIGEASSRNPATVVALAAERYLGPAGFWLVVVAGLLSMLSALHANLYGASRVALAMARDRTLPHALGGLAERRGTPVAAVVLTAGAVAGLLLVLPDVATAGAASSLIFLISFALTHWTSVLARRRGGRSGFRLPWFPLVPAVGAACCLGLAVFQGLAVTAAGVVATLWLGVGVGLYLTWLAPRARVADASSEALDPELARLRGHRPLVLVPIANPASARGLVGVASALAPRDVGRILLLSVVRPPAEWTPGDVPQALRDAQSVLGESLAASFADDLAPEAMVTVAADAWSEMDRVARIHACGCILLGLPRFDDALVAARAQDLVSRVDADVVVLRAPAEWRLSSVGHVLVPVGGRRDQAQLRARLLGRVLLRRPDCLITYLGVVPAATTEAEAARVQRELTALAHDETHRRPAVEIVRDDDPAGVLAARAADAELVMLGLQRQGRRRKGFGALPLRLARETATPLLLISQRG